MSDDAQVLSQLSGYLQSLPTRAPERVLRGALTTVATTEQRRPWFPALAMPVGGWRISRAAVLAFTAFASLAVLVVLAQVFGRLPTNLPSATQPVLSSASPSASPSDTSSPTTDGRITASVFEQPFSFVLPAGHQTFVAHESVKLVSVLSPLAPGDDATWAPGSSLYGRGSNGLVIASALGALVQNCPIDDGGTRIIEGQDFPAALRYSGGFVFDTTPATVGGLPGSVTSSITSTCPSYLDLGNRDIDAGQVALNGPFEKIFFVPVGNTTVLVQEWAASQAEAEAWLPIADQIVQSIQFRNPAAASPQAIPALALVAQFEKPFTYEMPTNVAVSVGQQGLKLVTLTSAARAGGATPGDDLHPPLTNGIVIASTVDGSMDGCPRPTGLTGHTSISADDDVISQLESKGGMGITSVRAKVAGLDAVEASVETASCTDHLYVLGEQLYDGMSLTGPARTISLNRMLTKLYFVSVDGSTLLMQAYASSSTDAETWFPIADHIVQTIAFTGAQPVPAPYVTTDKSVSAFAKPFSYHEPDGVELMLPAASSKFVTMISPLLTGPAGDWQPGSGVYPDSSNGIVLASSSGTSIDTCPRSIGFVPIRSFDDFAFRLKDQGGFAFDSTATTIGGREATRLSSITAACLDHFHLDSPVSGSLVMALTKPFEKVYLVPFDDTTVVIQIWSDSQAELDAWLPIADGIVQSLHFFDLPSQ